MSGKDSPFYWQGKPSNSNAGDKRITMQGASNAAAAASKNRAKRMEAGDISAVRNLSARQEELVRQFNKARALNGQMETMKP